MVFPKTELGRQVSWQGGRLANFPKTIGQFSVNDLEEDIFAGGNNKWVGSSGNNKSGKLPGEVKHFCFILIQWGQTATIIAKARGPSQINVCLH